MKKLNTASFAVIQQKYHVLILRLDSISRTFPFGNEKVNVASVHWMMFLSWEGISKTEFSRAKTRFLQVKHLHIIPNYEITQNL